jgi:hypothetical protein
MIYYLVTAAHAYTMHSFLRGWGEGLAGRIEVVTYESVLAGKPLPERDASYIFSDLDRLGGPRVLEPLGRLRDHLAGVVGARRVLNDPARSLLRFDLLRALHERGINRFNAYRAAGGETPRRFPVFLRHESGFQSEQPALLGSEQEYAAALRGGQASSRELIAVEFCDTADEGGVYRKYGAFVVGEAIVPRHVFFSRRWMVKDPDLADPAFLDEELAYMDANPHESELRGIFRLAGISYGRIDYAVLAGRLQVWEINTNPLPASFTEVIPERRAAHLRFVQGISAAFDALETPEGGA